MSVNCNTVLYPVKDVAQTGRIFSLADPKRSATTGSFPADRRRDQQAGRERQKYVASLRAADAGDLGAPTALRSKLKVQCEDCAAS